MTPLLSIREYQRKMGEVLTHPRLLLTVDLATERVSELPAAGAADVL